MKKRILICLLLGCLLHKGFAQVELLGPKEPKQFFGGKKSRIETIWQNTGNAPMQLAWSVKVFQASSATVTLIAENALRKFEVPPNQKVIEAAPLDFPTVKAETRFLVQWVESTNKVFGTTEVLVYPTNLLSELKTLAGNEPLGVFDPGNQLKPILKPLGIEFSDLEDVGLENCRGHLLIAGPFQDKKQIREGFASQIKALAEKGAAVVWLQPPADKKEGLTPSFFSLPEGKGKGTIIVAQGSLVENLAENPQAQINLIYLSRLALRPEAPRLPFSTSQP